MSLFSIARAAFVHVALNGNGNGKNGKEPRVVWDKTERNNNFNGHHNGRNGYHFENGRDGRNGSNGRNDGPANGPPRAGEGEKGK